MDGVLSLNELEAALAQAGPSPKDEGRLEMIVRRPDIDQREVLAQAELTVDGGLSGDNWHVKYSKSRPDQLPDPNAQITLMNSRVAQVVAQDRARWSLAGDQLYVDFDISEENLPAGTRIAIGEVVLEISALPHTGCAKFTARFGSDAIRFVNEAHVRKFRRRGANARVIQAGLVHQGDVIRKVAAD
jgi:hypothetical protein